MVKGDGAPELGDRDFQCVRNGANRRFGEEAVSVVKGVQHWKQRCGLVFPAVD